MNDFGSVCYVQQDGNGLNAGDMVQVISLPALWHTTERILVVRLGEQDGKLMPDYRQPAMVPQSRLLAASDDQVPDAAYERVEAYLQTVLSREEARAGLAQAMQGLFAENPDWMTMLGDVVQVPSSLVAYEGQVFDAPYVPAVCLSNAQSLPDGAMVWIARLFDPELKDEADRVWTAGGYAFDVDMAMPYGLRRLVTASLQTVPVAVLKPGYDRHAYATEVAQAHKQVLAMVAYNEKIRRHEGRLARDDALRAGRDE